MNSPVSIQVKQGSQKNIPEIQAAGKVVRSNALEDGTYTVCCSLTQVNTPSRRAE